MEIELRAKVLKKQTLKKKISSVVSSEPKESFQKDIYLKHSKDKERLLVFRTRETGQKNLFTIKAKNKGQDVAWHEFECSIDNPKILRTILLSNGFETVISLTKKRLQWKYKNMEINLDSIKELGDFVEIEIQTSTTNKGRALKAIEQLLGEFGIHGESIVREGYVQLALKNGPASRRK